MVVALEKFVKNLEDSGIVSPSNLKRFLPPRAAPKDAQDLARELVKQKQLTKFQVQEIYQGRASSLILGSYTILDKIGAGGMGQVFKAEHRRMHRVVAIKTLPANMMKDGAAVARFQREVEAAARLVHPNIVAAFDADECNGVFFLAMEYVEGSDLSALVKKNGPFPVEKAVSYILQAARGLEFAHGEGVVHRDVKPSNLLLDKKGTVKILDMGLARFNSPGSDAATQAELTTTGTIMGSVDYMAPEQTLNSKFADARADIYSLGCSLHYLLTGKAVYAGDTLMEKLLAHREQPIPTLGGIQADVPEHVAAVFSKMVAKDVDDRYQTMTEVVAALEQCNSSQPTSIGLQQSIGTSSSSNVMTFLRNVTLNTIHKAKPVKKLGRTKSGKKNTVVYFAIGGALLSLALLAGVIFKMQTKDGTLVVEVNQPDAVVQVLNEEGKVEISDRSGKKQLTLSVDPGKHKIKIEKDGFVAYGENFKIESGGKTAIKATLEPVKTEPVNDLVKPELVAENSGEADRSVANWWLAKRQGSPSQGFLYVETLGATKPIWSAKDLPAGPFRIVRLGMSKTTDLDLASIARLPSLGDLDFTDADVSDVGIERLKGLATLKQIVLHHTKVTPIGVAALQTTLPNCKIEWDDPAKVVAGQPNQTWNTPAFRTWMKDVQVLSAEKQIEAVSKKLVELNPGFDGKATSEQGNNIPKIENGVVTELKVLTNKVSDISPLRALSGLNKLFLYGRLDGPGSKGKLSDLSPLQGLKLSTFDCGDTLVSDLSPLAGMPLATLKCGNTPITDLSPLRGMPLRVLWCYGTQVSDLSPLQGMELTDLRFTPPKITKGMDVIRQITSLQILTNTKDGILPPAEFWKKYDAGEFGKSTAKFNDPAFQQWMKEVQALPAEEQVKAVSKKLVELNPGFDGKFRETPKIVNGIVTEISFFSNNVTDISPVRADRTEVSELWR